jgi:hypothetical protein
MGLIGLVCSPAIFIKLALSETVLSSNHLIICCDLLFDAAIISTSIGFILLRSATKENFLKLFCLICLSLSIFDSICDLLLLSSSYNKVISYIENFRTSSGILICCISLSYLIFAKNEARRTYDNGIMFVWILLSLVIFGLAENNPALLVMQTISGVVTGLAGYKIYMSEDPSIINENILYELSSH